MLSKYMHEEINLYQSCHSNHLILYIHNVDTLNICMKNFNAIKILFDKMTTYPFLTLCFLIRVSLVLR